MCSGGSSLQLKMANDAHDDATVMKLLLLLAVTCFAHCSTPTSDSLRVNCLKIGNLCVRLHTFEVALYMEREEEKLLKLATFFGYLLSTR